MMRLAYNTDISNDFLLKLEMKSIAETGKYFEREMRVMIWIMHSTEKKWKKPFLL